MADIAISYRRVRRKAVQYLVAILEAHGYSVWWDGRRLIGEPLSATVKAELTSARAVIVVWCVYSLESPWVPDEARLAIQNKSYLPIAIENVELPLGLQERAPFEMYKWDGSRDNEYLIELLRQVERLTGKTPRPNTDALRALDEKRQQDGYTGLSSFPLEIDPPSVGAIDPAIQEPKESSPRVSRGLEGPMINVIRANNVSLDQRRDRRKP